MIFIIAFAKKKNIKIICTGKGEQRFSEEEDIWKNIDNNIFTEQFWKNYPHLFRCSKCAYNSNTFIGFTDNGQTAVEVNNINNINDISNVNQVMDTTQKVIT